MAGSLKGLIQRMAAEGMPCIEKGLVAELDPIRITLVDDFKINLSAASLIIPYGMREQFEIGRQFWLLSLNGNNIFYVLGRAEE